jgi:hypothetical protein
MEKIIYKLISEFTKGVDTYTHNGSTWLIFTESKQWVIELTEEKTLWYNYNFFKSVFAYASLDCVQNQHLITKWVEDNIINKVSDIHFRDARDRKQQFEDTLENGVKNTKMAHMKTCWSVEDTIENGVKETYLSNNSLSKGIEYTIENGVKEVYDYKGFRTSDIKDTIQNGVKETKYNQSHQEPKFKEVLKNGVKHTRYYSRKINTHIERIIQNGVKETQFNSYENESWVEGVIKGGVKETNPGPFNVSQFLCEEVIDKGVKETKISPTHTDYGDWLDGDERLDEIIKNGVKETNHVDVMKFFDNKMEDTLENGIRLTEYQIGDTFDEIDDIIENGVKKTSPLDPSFSVRFIDGDENNDWEKVPNINEVIDNGIKETHREICEYKHTVEHIIQTGVKETFDCDWDVPTDLIKDVINDGVKVSGTFVGGKRQKEDVESVIGFGTKNPTD